MTNIGNNFAGKTEKTQFSFWPEIFHFLEQDRLLFARVEIGVTEYPTKHCHAQTNTLLSSLMPLHASSSMT